MDFDIEGSRAIVMQVTQDRVLSFMGFLLFFVLNVMMLMTGYLGKDDCPAQYKIPLYLFVAGAIGLLTKLLPFLICKFDWPYLRFILFITYLIEMGWTIMGSIWVYGTQPSFDPDSGSKYCHKHTYQFSFWLLTLYWGMVVVCFITCCLYFTVLRYCSAFSE